VLFQLEISGHTELVSGFVHQRDAEDQHAGWQEVQQDVATRAR
jgi:hypothetical protein